MAAISIPLDHGRKQMFGFERLWLCQYCDFCSKSEETAVPKEQLINTLQEQQIHKHNNKRTVRGGGVVYEVCPEVL
jgi:succinate dehydrogenase/fumarate reductase-like Fe-S protein